MTYQDIVSLDRSSQLPTTNYCAATLRYQNRYLIDTNHRLFDFFIAYLSIQIRRLSSEIPGASSVPDNPETLKALQNDKSISYTTASPSTQLNSSVHGEEHESTDFVNLDGSENLSEDLLEDPSDLFQPISIRKYETFEDESFYEQVHIKPFNK
ncbi:hypothetical protein EIK77_005578 [Talaromyces pinophilus]|nr:hypothetical protein EIK77_005578 [Talaromyces pinophilus]